MSIDKAKEDELKDKAKPNPPPKPLEEKIPPEPAKTIHQGNKTPEWLAWKAKYGKAAE